MRNILKYMRFDWMLNLLIIAIMLSGFIYVVSLSISDKRKIVHIAETHQTIHQFFESDIPVTHLYYVEIQPAQYVWWQMPMPDNFRISVPSGPPIFIFDEKGDLCDYSCDIGDDPRFQTKWSSDVNWGQELSLSDLKMKFANPIPTDDQPDDDNVVAIPPPNESNNAS